MAELTAGTIGPVLEAPPRRVRVGARRSFPVWRWVILLVAAVYFLVPLYAAFRFALKDATGQHTSISSFTGIRSQQGFSAAFTLSLRLAAVTLVLTLLLMVPTAVYVHLRLPKLRRVMEGITLLPIIIPPVVLIVGVLAIAPSTLKGTPYLLALEYVVLAMPFAYRSFDAGLSAIDLKTLVEASRSLGGGWVSTLLRVVVPNIRTALLAGTVLTVALVLGEFTLASLDQYQTFPVWIVNFDQTNAYTSVAASLLALVITWLFLIAISLLGGRTRRAKTGGS